MLAAKVMFAIIEELLSDPTPEALESLASLLNVVGPTFDVPEFLHQKLLTVVFDRVLCLIKEPKTKPRVRCLLKDVLDFRAAGWEDKKPKKMEAPTTLEEVAAKKASEEASSMSEGVVGWSNPRRSTSGYGSTSGKSSPSHWSNGNSPNSTSSPSCIKGLTSDLLVPGGPPTERSAPKVKSLASDLFAPGQQPKPAANKEKLLVDVAALKLSLESVVSRRVMSRSTSTP